MQQHLFNYFCTSGHCSFLEDVSLTLVDETDPSHPLKWEDYWRIMLKTMAPLGLNIEECVECSFITNILSICIFIGLGRFDDKDFWAYR